MSGLYIPKCFICAYYKTRHISTMETMFRLVTGIEPAYPTKGDKLYEISFKRGLSYLFTRDLGQCAAFET